MKAETTKRILAALALGATLATAAMPIAGADAGWYLARQSGWGEGAEWGVAGSGGFLGGYGGFWAGGRLGAMIGATTGPVGAVVGGTLGAGVGAL
jgi:hypothetical protein